MYLHGNKYILSAKLNENAMSDFNFLASELLQAGELESGMRIEPNKD